MPKRLDFMRGAAFAALCAGAMMAAPFSAEALRDKLGEVEINFDSTVRAGYQLRVQGKDCNLLWPGVTALDFDPDLALLFPRPTPGAHVGGNGGCGRPPLFLPDLSPGNLTPVFSGLTGDLVSAVPTAGTPPAALVTSDNGDLSVDMGELISAQVSGTHELEVRWRNFGIFARGLWYYDYIYRDTNSNFRPWSDAVADDLGGEFEMRDYFAFVDFKLYDVPVTLRVGPQVINWGESTFIQGGINSFQPIDVTVLRSPGINLREAYEPLPMVFAQIGLTPTVSLEGFWQWDYAETDLDPAGSYFSTADLAGPGAKGALLNAFVDPRFFNPDTFVPLITPGTPIFVFRDRDQGQEDEGEFGAALRYYAEWLNNGTDIGLFYVRYTSRLPYLTFANSRTPLDPPFNPFGVPLTTDQACTIAANLGGVPLDVLDPVDRATALGACLDAPVVSGADLSGTAFALLANETRLAYDFPSDIEVIGLSFSTVFGETALSGDFAFYPDLPLARPQLTEIACGNIQAAVVTPEVQAAIEGGLLGPLAQDGNIGNLLVFGPNADGTSTSPCIDPAPAVAGQFAKAFGEEHTFIGQFTTVSTFRESNRISQFLGADQIAAVFNLGFMWIPEMPDPLFERPYATSQSSTFHPDPRVAAVLVTPGATLGNEGLEDRDDGYADGFSAGFTFLVAPEYNSIFDTPIKAVPTLAWRYDFYGDSPGPIGPGFVQEQMQVNVGVTFEYLDAWQLRFGYTNFFGAGYQNQINDRDFFSGVLSYSF